MTVDRVRVQRFRSVQGQGEGLLILMWGLGLGFFGNACHQLVRSFLQSDLICAATLS